MIAWVWCVDIDLNGADASIRGAAVADSAEGAESMRRQDAAQKHGVILAVVPEIERRTALMRYDDFRTHGGTQPERRSRLQVMIPLCEVVEITASGMGDHGLAWRYPLCDL
jgi:hypothetical protein